MARTYATAANAVRNPPSDAPIPGREAEMVENSCGHFAFGLDRVARARRFLILGTEGGSYYIGEPKLTAANAGSLVALLADPTAGPGAVEMIADISDRGLAHKVSPCLFSLALAFASPVRAVRRAAADALPTVVRTNSHMLEFISYADTLRGWGRTLREAVGGWYNNQAPANLEYQIAKYRNRSGWTTRDALRMAKPVPPTPQHSALFSWAVGKAPSYLGEGPIEGMRVAAAETSKHKRADIIAKYRLSHEMLPSEWLGDIDVWKALLGGMPMHALLRNLGRITSISPDATLGRDAEDVIIGKLANTAKLLNSRVHPMALLLALSVYKSGRGVKGNLSWRPSTRVIDALDGAFYESWHGVVPAGKRTMIALDVSGSMHWSYLMGTPLTCAEGAAAMAMVTAATEPHVGIYGFCHELVPLEISTRRRLDDNVATIRGLPFGSTNCAAPFEYALARKLEFDTFVVYTDNETNTSRTHPSIALRNYRDKTGIAARLAVVGMAANNFSIADPADAGMLDVVGFDASAPQVISRFSAGEI